MEALVSGGNQDWYNFKRALTDHVSCSSIRSGGHEHFKAKQYEIKERKRNAQNLKVNTNLVSAAIQVCKMKAAALNYENMIGFLSFCGSDVGAIGHGRWELYFIVKHRDG